MSLHVQCSWLERMWYILPVILTVNILSTLPLADHVKIVLVVILHLTN